MADVKNSPKPRKVIDVTAPGKSAPPTSGRPIIVTNRPVLKQDPMMIPVVEATDENSTKKVSRISKTIPKPSSAEEKSKGAPALPKAEVEALESDPPVIKGSAEEKADPEKEPGNAEAPPPPENNASKEKPASEIAATFTDEPGLHEEDQEEKDGTADDQLAPNQALENAAQKEKDEKTAQAAEQERIIESKKYFLPINTVEKRRLNQRALILLVLVILITIAWLDITLDAGIIKLGHLHALTHFFSQ